MFSNRFQRTIWLTFHATLRMKERQITEPLLLDLIETGIAKYKDDRHLWLFKTYLERSDNQLCAAAILNDEALIVKTVMHHFQPE